MKYANNPKSITTERTKSKDPLRLPLEGGEEGAAYCARYIPLAISQSDRVTKASSSRKSPLVL